MRSQEKGLSQEGTTLSQVLKNIILFTLLNLTKRFDYQEQIKQLEVKYQKEIYYETQIHNIFQFEKI